VVNLKFQIFVKDVWKEYTGWPLNDMEGQYKFMVKHVQLWKVAFHSTSPKWIHSVYLAAVAAYYARYIPLVMLYTFMINYDYFTLITIHLLRISIIIILYCFVKQQQLLDLTSLEKFTLEFQTSKYQLMINKSTVVVMCI